tara:strand:- start:386 stop:1087 length:702 start_codon:yes stop_codon:yes gene_type:complete
MYLRSFLFYILYVLSGVVIGIAVCLVSIFLPVKKRIRVASIWPRFASWCLLKICKIEIEIKGQQNIPETPFVLVSNHQSSWEAYFFQYFFFPVTTLLKRELLVIPIWGWALALLGPIYIDRKKAKTALVKFMEEGQNKLDSGFIVLSFPEGTRVEPGKIGGYARSAFELAKRSGVPLLPVVHNAGSYWEAHKFIKRPGKISLDIGEKIEVKNSAVQAKEVENWSRDKLVNMQN